MAKLLVVFVFLVVSHFSRSQTPTVSSPMDTTLFFPNNGDASAAAAANKAMGTLLEEAEETVGQLTDADNLILSPDELLELLDKDTKEDPDPVVDTEVVQGLFQPDDDVTAADDDDVDDVDDVAEVVQETLESLGGGGDDDDVMEDVNDDAMEGMSGVLFGGDFDFFDK